MSGPTWKIDSVKNVHVCTFTFVDQWEQSLRSTLQPYGSYHRYLGKRLQPHTQKVTRFYWHHIVANHATRRMPGSRHRHDLVYVVIQR